MSLNVEAVNFIYWQLNCLTLDSLGCGVSHTCFVFSRFSVSVLAKKVVCLVYYLNISTCTYSSAVLEITGIFFSNAYINHDIQNVCNMSTHVLVDHLPTSFTKLRM